MFYISWWECNYTQHMLIKPLSKYSSFNEIQGILFPPIFSKPAKYKFQIQEQNPSAHYSWQVTSNYLEVYMSGFHPVFHSIPSRDSQTVIKEKCNMWNSRQSFCISLWNCIALKMHIPNNLLLNYSKDTKQNTVILFVKYLARKIEAPQPLLHGLDSLTSYLKKQCSFLR